MLKYACLYLFTLEENKIILIIDSSAPACIRSIYNFLHTVIQTLVTTRDAPLCKFWPI